MAESKYLQVEYETPTEKINGGQEQASANVANEARTKVADTQENQNEYAGSVSGEVEVEIKVLGEQKKFAGSYLGNQKQVEGFERSKGDKGVVNTITVEETKTLIKQSQTYTLKQLQQAIETIRQGQYVEVDTEEYPTLEDFLESTGEQGTVYLYPLDNDGHYDQYIWENGVWVGLGNTELDLSNYVDLSSTQTITGAKTFSNGIYFTNNEYIALDNNEKLNIYFGGVPKLLIDSLIQARQDLIPYSNNVFSLGINNARWKDLYLAGVISDGTNSIKVANIVASIFNVIDASEMTDSTHLTQDQVTLLKNGKPTLFIGTLGTLTNFIIMSYYTSQTTGYIQLFVFWGSTIYGIYVNLTDGNIGLLGATDRQMNLRSIISFNGKNIPAYPSSTGTFTLKCVDGVLTWVAD